jgi:hypothetical protein
VRRGPPDTGAAAEARCSIWRSTTTRARIRPTTRDGWCRRSSAPRLRPRTRRLSSCHPRRTTTPRGCSAPRTDPSSACTSGADARSSSGQQNASQMSRDAWSRRSAPRSC